MKKILLNAFLILSVAAIQFSCSKEQAEKISVSIGQSNNNVAANTLTITITQTPAYYTPLLDTNRSWYSWWAVSGTMRHSSRTIWCAGSSRGRTRATVGVGTGVAYKNSQPTLSNICLASLQ